MDGEIVLIAELKSIKSKRAYEGPFISRCFNTLCSVIETVSSTERFARYANSNGYIVGDGKDLICFNMRRSKDFMIMDVSATGR